MRIERSIAIKKSSEEVFNYLKYTRNQDNFSVWNMADPDMKKEQSGTDGEVGFIYRWDSKDKNVGAGEQKITAIIPGKRIDSEIMFFRPMENTGKTSFIVNEAGSGLTNVEWIFDSPSKFPMVLFAPIFKKMLGRDLAKGLDNLKGILEK
ncbi:MAG TPA: SRPBCC family protein [Bacteroidales bacterium]|nr:SRPBCC family protein [Bacteroidales bacterium]